MEKSLKLTFRFFAIIFSLVFIATVAFSFYNFIRQADSTEISIFCANNYTSDNPVNIILYAKDAAKKEPLPNQKISLAINGKMIAPLRTESDGTAMLELKHYPKDGFTFEAAIGEHKVKNYINIDKASEESKTHIAPKKIEFKVDKTFYAPGEIIQGSIKNRLSIKTGFNIKSSLTFRLPEKSDYSEYSMFGEPSPPLETLQQVPYRKITSVIDPNSTYKFELKLPEKFKKIDFSQEDSICELIISTESEDDIEEKLKKEIIITTRNVRIKSIPEFSKFIKGFPRNIHILVCDPAGKALEAELVIMGNSIKTDNEGLVLFEVPDEVTVEKTHVDAIVPGAGKATDWINLEYASCPGSFTVKTDKLFYVPGDIAQIDVLSNSNQRIFINIAKGNKSFKIIPLQLQNNKASCTFKIPENMHGLIQINAIKVTPSGLANDVHVVQVSTPERKNPFPSPAQITRARLKTPENAEFEYAQNFNSFLRQKGSLSYSSRSRKLVQMKIAYGKNLFCIALPVLFVIFTLLFICFIRLWFYTNHRNFSLIMPEQLMDKTRNNIFVAVPLYIITNIAFTIIYNGILKIDKYKSFSEYNYIINTAIFIYLLSLVILLYRSFRIRDLLIKLPSNENGDKIKDSIFLSPYLLLIAIIFQQGRIFSKQFLEESEWAVLLSFILTLMFIVWLILVLRMRSFYYTRDEYNSIKSSFECAKKNITNRLGRGIGAYPTSFIGTWIFGGYIFCGIPLFVYFLVALVVIAMLLPLVRIVECLC